MTEAPQVSVAAEPADDPALAECAAALAAALGLPFISQSQAAATPMVLVRTPARLELRVLRGEPALVGGHPLAIELTQLDTRTGPGRSLKQPLLKAAGLRKGEPRPSVLDATAGLGEDAWLLASAGCTVMAVERSAVVAALLRDAIVRAAAREPEAAGRLRVVHGESAAVLREMAAGDRPDVVYVDPMFPIGRKAAERKPMRIVRWLVGDDADAAALLAAALATAKRRVVVKRPSKAAMLGGREPTHSHHGKSVRYDVYAIGGAAR
ncbi:MAG: class I SAM-dependent methyltransferase [Phycisphaeraceae bacterium]